MQADMKNRWTHPQAYWSCFKSASEAFGTNPSNKLRGLVSVDSGCQLESTNRFHSFLAVPIVSRDCLHGELYVSDAICSHSPSRLNFHSFLSKRWSVSNTCLCFPGTIGRMYFIRCAIVHLRRTWLFSFLVCLSPRRWWWSRLVFTDSCAAIHGRFCFVLVGLVSRLITTRRKVVVSLKILLGRSPVVKALLRSRKLSPSQSSSMWTIHDHIWSIYDYMVTLYIDI